MGMRDYLKERPLLYYTAKHLGTVGLIAIASLWTYTHHTSIQRLEDSLFRRNVPVREGFFPDPAGVSVQIEVCEDGYKSGYLIHEDSDYKHALEDDLLPDTGYIIDRLQERAKRLKEEDIKGTLEKIIEIQKTLYGRL